MAKLKLSLKIVDADDNGEPLSEGSLVELK
jgi:hypothetical protein